MNTEIKTYLNSLNYDELREYLKARKTVEMEEREREKRAANLAVAVAIIHAIECAPGHIFNRLTDLTYAVSCDMETPISREKVKHIIKHCPDTCQELTRSCDCWHFKNTTYYGSPKAIRAKKRELGR